MAKKIQLTQNQETIVDDIYYQQIIDTCSWRAIKQCSGSLKYRVQGQINQKDILLHRFIMELAGHNIIGKQIDHIDGDPLNNQISNLRLCNNQQNKFNIGKRHNNKSGYKGVYWDKKNKKWKCQMSLNNKRKHLGYYSNKEDAAKAYNQAALKYHGQFANLNIIK